MIVTPPCIAAEDTPSSNTRPKRHQLNDGSYAAVDPNSPQQPPTDDEQLPQATDEQCKDTTERLQQVEEGNEPVHHLQSSPAHADMQEDESVRPQHHLAVHQLEALVTDTEVHTSKHKQAAAAEHQQSLAVPEVGTRAAATAVGSDNDVAMVDSLDPDVWLQLDQLERDMEHRKQQQPAVIDHHSWHAHGLLTDDECRLVRA